ncbi:MAG TPA: polyphosphate kinase 2 family protein [Candidatus Acidoferrales bacterium]|jgi:PPK2 family polyphosphate:nucleotide phosphotransferase|nr:polyphosphate kinase 2 family protein [Candidatus Acidoferrales bacterium]HWF13229.1 polyphosphate kinase 2 family protein [Candidatus Acidoferrales bacterium]
MKTKHIARAFEVKDGSRFRLKDFDPAETLDLKSKEHAQDALERGIARLSELQEKLYAQDRWAILMNLQAMDAAGKDSTIKHVMSGVNPQGCQVHSFKAPSAEELQHDFLWRTTRSLPERGGIGIFNRSYYEEVLAVRVHPEFLTKEKVPAELTAKNIWEKRFEDINAFERYLSRNGYKVLKFFLYVSKREQKSRFLDRLDEDDKNWKFSISDVQERKHWDKYMHAYEDMIRNTSTEHAPWYVVPADHKWFSRLVVAEVIVHTLQSLNLAFPKLDAAKRKELKGAREALERTN